MKKPPGQPGGFLFPLETYTDWRLSHLAAL